jgi:putative nucleotidyltransferase with HDIG domain
MRKATGFLTVTVIALAALAVFCLYRLQPSVPKDAFVAMAFLSGLALIAEVLQYGLPRGARATIAFVPYLSTVIIAPFWPTPIVILFVKAATEIARKAERWKTVFNIAQYVLAVSMAIACYRVLGGPSLLKLSQGSLLAATASAGIPAMGAVVVCYFTNSVLVSIAIALNTRTPLRAVWKELKNPTAVLDVLAGPMVFMFAWIYAAFGGIAAAAAWVPFIGYRHAHKTNLELEQTNRELLELMVKSLEARDQYTSGHSRRVQHASTVIARAIGLSSGDVARVSRAALLHDVGKIHEKYAPILSKNDLLSTEEWAVMKEHPADGAALVSTMTKLQDVVPAIRHHHENWDGTGYPDGLAGERIPLASRIIRFADTIDAMITERPYRRPLTQEQVRSEVVRCRGSQFDPAIADQLLSSSLWTSLFSPVVASTESLPRPELTVVVGSRRRAGVLNGTKASGM